MLCIALFDHYIYILFCLDSHYVYDIRYRPTVTVNNKPGLKIAKYDLVVPKVVPILNDYRPLSWLHHNYSYVFVISSNGFPCCSARGRGAKIMKLVLNVCGGHVCYYHIHYFTSPPPPGVNIYIHEQYNKLT